MAQKGIAPLLIVIVIAALVGGYFIYQKQAKPTQTACTQDAKICPDGSAVGRTGPRCEFAPCPSPADETANWKIYTHPRFSFKYPPNLYAEENPEYPGGNNVDFFLVGTKADFGYGDHIGNEIFGFEFSQDDRTLEELKTEYYPKAINITIGGKPALKTFIGNSAFDVKLSKNESLRIAVWNADEASQYLDQILSTFKFLP